jgi:predicted secreted protein
MEFSMKHLVLALGVLLAAAAPAVAQVAVSDADDGGTVAVVAGEALTLSVPINGGAPYAWKITADGSPQLAFTGEGRVAQKPGLIGGPANAVFSFTAAEAGETTLTAALLPVSGGDPARTVTIRVNVTAGAEHANNDSDSH